MRSTAARQSVAASFAEIDRDVGLASKAALVRRESAGPGRHLAQHARGDRSSRARFVRRSASLARVAPQRLCAFCPRRSAHPQRAAFSTADRTVDRPHARDVVAPARRPTGDRRLTSLPASCSAFERRDRPVTVVAVRRHACRRCRSSTPRTRAARVAASRSRRAAFVIGRARRTYAPTRATLRRRVIGKSALGAPPQHVVPRCAHSSCDQIVDLARGEPGAEILAEVAGRCARRRAP